MSWRIIIAVILFIISIAGILFTGNILLDFLDKIFDNKS
jgi:NADH:ubiquinone oxidoreductase subunit K